MLQLNHKNEHYITYVHRIPNYTYLNINCVEVKVIPLGTEGRQKYSPNPFSTLGARRGWVIKPFKPGIDTSPDGPQGWSTRV
jgi:hypothetical protein